LRTGILLYYFDNKHSKNICHYSGTTGLDLIGMEMAPVVAEEIVDESLSEICRALALWLALSEYTTGASAPDGEGAVRRKSYYKHFVPVLLEGLKSS
jgi:hypothetical protein